MSHLHAMAQELFKLAQLPEPPPDSGEPPAATQTSEPEPVKHPWRHAAKTLGVGTLAFGAGTAAGYGVQHGVEKVLGKHVTPTRLRAAAPVLSGLMGLAYTNYKSKEKEELHRALQSHKNQRAAGPPVK